MEGRIVKMEMMLQTQNLCKYFRKQKAVNNVSLNIEKGQIYGLLGPNGAGKSTTLKMLTGMMKPTAGKIYFDGKLLDRKDLSKIGALIENPPIYGDITYLLNLIKCLHHTDYSTQESQRRSHCDKQCDPRTSFFKITGLYTTIRYY